MTPDTIITLILKEYYRAIRHNATFNSAHEGYAVLAEEVDELWDEVKKKARSRSQFALLKEAVQVGAMALRFALDVVADDEAARDLQIEIDADLLTKETPGA